MAVTRDRAGSAQATVLYADLAPRPERFAAVDGALEAALPPTCRAPEVADTHRLVVHVGRRRATVVFWTPLGILAVAVSLLSLVRPVLHLSDHQVRFGPWPAPGVLGALLVAHMQLVYPTRLRLELDGAGFSFRNLLGTRRVAWDDVEAVDGVSALTPQGRGGNMSALRLRMAAGTLLIPDVFTLRRDALRTTMLRYMGSR